MLWLGIGWTAVALVVAGLGLRWWGWSHPVMIAVVAVTPLIVAIPLVIGAAAAWPSRSRLLQGSVLVVAIGTVATVASPSALIGCGPSEATAAADEIVVYSHNLRWDNDDVDAIAATIAGADADVVLLQEVRRHTQKQLLERPSLAGFHHATTDSIDELIEIAVWSRWPLGDVNLRRVEGRPILAATIQSPQGAFRVHNVHLAAPVNANNGTAWASGLDDLAELQSDAPALLGGDFNATAQHAQFRSLLDRGWTDVHGPKGCGLDATWPAEGGVGLPVLQLDHVLVSHHWEVLAVVVGDASGSDHRPVITTLELTG